MHAKETEELQKRTGGTTAPGQTAPTPAQQPAAVPPPAGVSDAEKILVWADPSSKLYYREGDPQNGKSGGRCMMEKIAKKNGLSAAAGEKKD